uniref:Uncharacterized protein n=1 Tax=Lutzomyia longipalpis TaxID=7200 RepID=A0A1B0CGP1_LUTLO
MEFCGKVCNCEAEAVVLPVRQTNYEKLIAIRDKMMLIYRRHSKIVKLWHLSKYFLADFTAIQMEIYRNSFDVIRTRIKGIHDDINKLAQLDKDSAEVGVVLEQLKTKVDEYDEKMLPCMWMIGGPSDEWDTFDEESSQGQSSGDSVPTVWPAGYISDYTSDESNGSDLSDEDVQMEE